MGVGPTSQAWEARILPMYYIRIFHLFYFWLNIFLFFTNKNYVMLKFY